MRHMQRSIAAWLMLWAVSAPAQVLIVKRLDGNSTRIPLSEIASLQHEIPGATPSAGNLLVKRKAGNATRILLSEIATLQYDMGGISSLTNHHPLKLPQASVFVRQESKTACSGRSAGIEYGVVRPGSPRSIMISIFDVYGRRVRKLENHRKDIQ